MELRIMFSKLGTDIKITPTKVKIPTSFKVSLVNG